MPKLIKRTGFNKLKFEVYIFRVDVIAALAKTREAKQRHKETANCKKKCTACHFYSGGINALEELLGNTGIIN